VIIASEWNITETDGEVQVTWQFFELGKASDAKPVRQALQYFVLKALSVFGQFSFPFSAMVMSLGF